MQEIQEPKQARQSRGSSWLQANLMGVTSVALLLVFGVLAFGYGGRQRATIDELVSNQTEMSATIGQMQSHFNIITAKLDEISAAQSGPVPPVKPPHTPSGPSEAAGAPAKRTTVETEQWEEMRARIGRQQRQLNEMEASLAKARSDFAGGLQSTHDELNGAIAKTHEELVALEKRGERNYFEFDLPKAKEFQRSGPLLLSLRNADPKHQNFDLAIVVNDNTLTKKKVNLYEPVWIYQNSDRLPVQVVVNKISKDLVHGYVSVPRYSQEELASNEATTVR